MRQESDGPAIIMSAWYSEGDFTWKVILIRVARISVDSKLIRKVPAAYSDGVYAMAGQDRPSPRKLSDLFMQGDDGLPSVKNRTALFAFFGEDNNIQMELDKV